MLELQLQNINGAGDINSYVSGMSGSYLNIKLGEYTIKEFVAFDERFNSYVKAITTDDKMLILQVDSITEKNVVLYLVKDIVFNSCDEAIMLTEHLILRRYKYSNMYTIYNLSTGKVIYKIRDSYMRTLHGENGYAMIHFYKEIIVIEDNKPCRKISSIEDVHYYASKSSAFLVVKLKDKDICYLMDFNKTDNKFRIREVFDLFLTIRDSKNAFAVKNNKLYLYNQANHSSTLIRDFKYKAFEITGLDYNVDDKENTFVYEYSNFGLRTGFMEGISVRSEGVVEFIDINGRTVDTSIKEYFQLDEFLVCDGLSYKYIGYIRTDGSSWVYDIKNKRNFYIGINEEVALQPSLYRQGMHGRYLEFCAMPIVKDEFDLIYCEKIFDNTILSFDIFKENNGYIMCDDVPVMIFHEEDEILIKYIIDGKLVTLKNDFRGSGSIDYVCKCPNTLNVFALKLKTTVNDFVGALRKQLDYKEIFSKIGKCVIMSPLDETCVVRNIGVESLLEYVEEISDQIKINYNIF